MRVERRVDGISWPLLITIRIGPVEFYTHTVGIVVGCAVGALVFRHRAIRRGVWAPEYGEALMAAVPGALIGSRLGWALPFWLTETPIPSGELTTRTFTHISFLGGLVGAWTVALVWLRLARKSVWPVVGLAAETVAGGLLIARVGDLLVGDHLGRRTSSPLGFRVPRGPFRPNGHCFNPGDVCHQTALYEFVLVAVLLGASLLVVRRWRASEHICAAFLLIAYGIVRFAGVEPFRASLQWGNLTGSQWTSLGLVGLGILVGRGSKRPASLPAAVPRSAPD